MLSAKLTEGLRSRCSQICMHLRRPYRIYQICRRGGALPLPRRMHCQKRTHPSASVFALVHANLQHCTAGRGRTPPLRNRGNFYGFALVRSNLQRPTAQSFRHGFAVPPPFTQGRLWCSQNAPQLKTYNPSSHPSAFGCHLPLKGKALGALFQVVGIHDQRHRAVIDRLHQHMCSKLAVLRGEAEAGALS